MKTKDKIIIGSVVLLVVACLAWTVYHAVKAANAQQDRYEQKLIDKGYEKGFREGVDHAVDCVAAERKGNDMLRFWDGACVNVIIKFDFK